MIDPDSSQFMTVDRLVSRRLHLLAAALLAVVALAGLYAGQARAATNAEELFRIPSTGVGTGQLEAFDSIATDPTAGHIFVSQFSLGGVQNERINEFTPWGKFVKAFGWDVAPGSVNEEQEVRVRAASGQFRLSFGAGGPGVSESGDLAFDAGASQVEAALNSLSNISTGGGSVAVEASLGTADGVTPSVYVVTFKGSLGAKDVAQLSPSNGTTPLGGGSPSTNLAVRTRADGTAGGTGLESCTEESQCKAAVSGAGPGQFATSPQIAVDSAGDIYALEVNNNTNFNGTDIVGPHRVQKFDSAGRFLSAFGAGVLDSGAVGTGTLTAGSPLVRAVETTQRAFAVGQTVTGSGIPAGTRITAIGERQLTLSHQATASGAAVPLEAPTPPENNPQNERQVVRFRSTPTHETFALTFFTLDPSATGRAAGGYITAKTESGSPIVTAVVPVTGTGDLTAGSKIVEGASNGLGGIVGEYAAGQTIEGVGIPPGTTIEEKVSGPEQKVNLVLSAPATVTASTVPFSTSPAGRGSLSAGSNVVSNVEFSPSFPRGGEITGPGIPPNTTVVEKGGNTLTLSASATSSGSGVVISPKVSIAPGQTVAGPGIPAGTKVLSVAPDGDLTLSANAIASATAVGLSAGIPNTATAGEVQTILEGLENIGAGNVSVSGSAGGPWTIEYRGTRFADTNVPVIQISEQEPYLRTFGNEPAREHSAVVTETVVEGTGAAEICTAAEVAEAYACDGGVSSTAPGGLSLRNSMAVGADGDLYLPEGKRIQKFAPDGSFTEEFKLQAAAAGIASIPTGGFWVDGSGESVQRLSAAGAEESSCAVEHPGSLASAPEGGFYALIPGTNERVASVRQFTAKCKEVSQLAEAEHPPNEPSDRFTIRGIGSNGFGDLFASNTYNNNGRLAYVGAYGPPPVNYEAPPSVPPTISAEFATSVQRDGATLAARINPHFWADTRYYLEYGTGKCSEGGCQLQKPPAPGALLGKTAVDAQVLAPGVSLEGLTPGTTYHYRFVAESGGGGPVVGAESTFITYPTPLGKATCANEDFRGGLSATLPDCRAYEMVSPVDKSGGDIKALIDYLNYPTAVDQASTDGERFTYSAYRAFAGSEAAPYTIQYMAGRHEGAGWMTQGITPRQGVAAVEAYGLPNLDNEYRAFSPDLCQAWMLIAPEPALVSGGSEESIEVYRRDNCGTPSYEVVAPGSLQPELQGFSADGTAALLRANEPLTSGAAPTPTSSTYYASGGALHLICVLPSGVPTSRYCSAGIDPELSNTGPNVGENSHVSVLTHAISADGSRAYWTEAGKTLPEVVTNEGTGTVFLRENPGQEQSKVSGEKCTEPEKACTVPVSGTATTKASRFLSASSDGSKALFEVTEGTAQGKIYEFQLGGKTREIAAKSVGLAAASEDLSYIYFASEEVLSGTHGATAGKPNLYLDHEGARAFIATLSRADVFLGAAGGQTQVSNTTRAPVYHAARASLDGNSLLFISTASLTGYDNTDQTSSLPCNPGGGASEGVCDSEVYLYQAGASGPTCISCNPSGARPQGGVWQRRGGDAVLNAAASLPMANNQLGMPRAISANGSRVLFNSYDALSLRDTNGKEDVYEWERASSQKECEEKTAELYVEASGGCLSLITSGESPQDSELLDISAEGRDAFFTTNASLLPQDPGLVDVYDARQDGGFAQPVKTAGCEGESCQGPFSPPSDPTPGSSTFEGPGNVVEKPAKNNNKKNKSKKKHHSSSKKKKAKKKPAKNSRGGKK